MISNQILQNTIDGLKGITRIDLCIIDVEGKVLAATFPEADQYIEPAQAFVESPADSQVVNGYQFFKVFDEHQLEYILLASGDSDDVYMVGKIASFQIQNLLVAYKERFDKDNFIKNLLLDNLLLVDIYNRAKKLHIDTEVRRVVFIVETNRDKDGNELEKIRGIFGTKTKDFVTAVDEKNIIVVKEVGENEGYEELNKIAESMVNLFRADADSDVHVAYGTIVGEIKEVSALVEKPNESEKLSNYAIIGRYVLDGGIFGEIRKLKQRGSEIILTEAFQALAERGGIVASEFSGIRYDVGDKAGYVQANVEFALRSAELNAAMRAYIGDLAKKL